MADARRSRRGRRHQQRRAPKQAAHDGRVRLDASCDAPSRGCTHERVQALRLRALAHHEHLVHPALQVRLRARCLAPGGGTRQVVGPAGPRAHEHGPSFRPPRSQKLTVHRTAQSSRAGGAALKKHGLNARRLGVLSTPSKPDQAPLASSCRRGARSPPSSTCAARRRSREMARAQHGVDGAAPTARVRVGERRRARRLAHAHDRGHVELGQGQRQLLRQRAPGAHLPDLDVGDGTERFVVAADGRTSTSGPSATKFLQAEVAKQNQHAVIATFDDGRVRSPASRSARTATSSSTTPTSACSAPSTRRRRSAAAPSPSPHRASSPTRCSTTRRRRRSRSRSLCCRRRRRRRRARRRRRRSRGCAGRGCRGTAAREGRRPRIPPSRDPPSGGGLTVGLPTI